MKLFLPLLTVLVIASLLTSCSIEKRHYMSGYHVEWKHADKGIRVVGDVPPAAHKDEALLPDTVAATVLSEDAEIVEAPIPGVPVKQEPQKDKVSEGKRKPVEAWAERIQKLKLQHGYAGALNVPDEGRSVVGNIFSIIAFVLALVAVAAFIAALSATDLWSGLGFISLAFIIAVAAFVFAVIAQIFFRINGDSTPWYQWIALVIGTIGFIIAIAILVS